MEKVISIKEATNIAQTLKQSGKSIVLAGGCFDILHEGHISFLNAAKKHGDYVFVLLESDEKIKKLKGNKRPINNQKNRAIVLSNLRSVDYVIINKGVTKDEDYDKLIVQIRPNIIAVTKGDSQIKKRNAQSEMIGGKTIEVIGKIQGFSTTDLIGKIKR